MSRARLAAVLAVLAAAWAVTAGVELFTARRSVSAATGALAAIEQPSVSSVVSGSGAARLDRAHAALAHAHRVLSSPLLVPLRPVPVLGRQLRAATALADAGSRVTEVGRDLLGEVDRGVADLRAGGKGRPVAVEELASAIRGAQARLRPVSLGPSVGLVRPLAEARRRAETDLGLVRSRLDELAAGLDGMSGFLRGPRRYLVLAANNAEMRTGSGMPLSIGVLEVRDGDLRLQEMRSVGELPPLTTELPVDPDLQGRWGWVHPGRDLRNANLTPRFDVSAALFSRISAAAGVPAVDGAFLLDPVALRALLSATGPVASEWGRVGADNVVRLVLHDQYAGVASQGNGPRREALSAIAKAAVAALNTDVDLARLSEGMAQAVGGRHLLAWSARPEDQALWELVGADGRVPPEALVVSVVNRGGNKLDQFLETSARLEVHHTPDGTDAALHLRVQNETPATEPEYVLGAYRAAGVPRGTYTGVLAVTLPGDASDGHIDGEPRLSVAGADGSNLVVRLGRDPPRWVTRPRRALSASPGAPAVAGGTVGTSASGALAVRHQILERRPPGGDRVVIPAVASSDWPTNDSRGTNTERQSSP